ADDAASATLRDGLERAAALADVWHEDPDLTFPEVASQLGNDVTAARSVPAALWAAAVADGADEVLELALGVGGDADTIAAMAGAVAGAAVGAAGLPEDWVARLENGPRGRRYARALAERIATRP
ncbi:MAG TPA: ADP-ribosylglycohydrolase family protein, partial [Nitriliruptorales bacterium]|nr:ADP-ribosylglycohydrolase family protein [Nitriliruptorales bacterium]